MRYEVAGVTEIHVVAAVIVDEGRAWIARRRAPMDHGGMWEFPGGKVQSGEDPRFSLKREIREEFGADVEVGACLGEHRHHEHGRIIRLQGFWTRMLTPPTHLTDHDETRWCLFSDLARLRFSPADAFIVKALQAGQSAPSMAP